MEAQTNTEKPKKKSGVKRFIFSSGLLLMCAGLFVVVAGFLWYGGYAKKMICSTVTTDSALYDRFSCSPAENASNTQNQFPLEKPDLGKYFTQGASGDEGTVESVVEEASKGVVGIGVVGDNFTEDKVIGTGFLISRGGLIVTNRHVVQSETVEYFIMFKDQKESVTVSADSIVRDPVNDVALIRFSADKIPADAKPLVIGDSEGLKLGQTVIAIGNPLGKYSGTVTKGIISGLNREVAISQGFFTTQSQTYQNVIQTDTAINPGNSGGPLLSLTGEVVGVNFATIEGASNMSFALPINTIKQRVAELEQYNKFKIPYLGVEYRTRVVFVEGKSMMGAEVTRVVLKSPAEAGGILVGDVIVDFNGSDLNETVLSDLIQRSKIGETTPVIILRNRKQVELNVVIGER